MAKLTKHLEYFIQYKLNTDALYQRMDQIILSSHEVPGEGEHKIMEYIRSACSKPDYNAETRHCIYGLDADLIMLGLTSGQDNFALLREEVKFGGSSKNNNKHSKGGRKDSPTGSLLSNVNTVGIDVTKTKFYIMQLGVVREYLCKDFYLHGEEDDTVNEEDEEFIGHRKQVIDVAHFERSTGALVNDFIFLSILVGNDFIPHLPHLHINSGAYQFIFDAYKRALITFHQRNPNANFNFCINNNGSINWDVFLLVCEELRRDYEQTIYDSAKADLEFLGRRGRNEFGGKCK
jgi:5'-3' exoribonuclease 1